MIYIRVPTAIIDIADVTVKTGLYQNRTEVLRELMRRGMRSLLYNGRGGFCIDLKKMVDCCHDDECHHRETCRMYTEP